jgi:hypothetical protein
MIAAGLVGGRHRFRHVESADQHHAVAERLQGLVMYENVKSLPCCSGTPIARRCAMGMPDADESPHRRRGGQTCRRQRRHHRLEEWQRQGHPGAAQERSSVDMLLGDKHESLL